MKSSKIIAVIIAIVVAIWIGSSFIAPPPNDAEDEQQVAEQIEEEKPLVKVRVREITAEEFPDTILLTGRSQASRSVVVKAEVRAPRA